VRRRDLVRRELRIVFGARVTWFVLATSALLVGHSFVLAVDLYSAASRSALGFGLMQREMDPLAGIVRPLLGGVHLATSLLVPVIAARGLAVERERRSYGALAIAAGGTTPIVCVKGLAAGLACALLLLPVVVLVLLFVVLGGHVDAIETAVALSGHLLHLGAFTAVALAAAACTRTVAQATTVAIAVSLASWAIDAGEGFAALAWLGRLDWASVSKELDPFEHGLVPLGSILWFGVLGSAAASVAILAAMLEAPRRRWLLSAPVAVVGVLGLAYASGIVRAYDWSEQRRASLPPAAVDALRAMHEPIRIELYLDREDGRRAQVERDVLSKLRLARPDVAIEAPLDRRERPREGEREDGYGRIVIHVGDAVRETRSTSRKEISTLVFEAAGRPLPDWSQAPYAGYPTVIEGARRTVAASVAYVVLPAGFVVVGWFLTRIRRRRS
jgi:ABC-2 type transport system permease protein